MTTVSGTTSESNLAATTRSEMKARTTSFYVGRQTGRTPVASDKKIAFTRTFHVSPAHKEAPIETKASSGKGLRRPASVIVGKKTL
jgi:hypothetical protein